MSSITIPQDERLKKRARSTNEVLPALFVVSASSYEIYEEYGMSTGFGIENMMLEGNSTPNFIHHYNSEDKTLRENTGLTDNDYHDGGFSGVKIACFKNSWARNLTFKNWSNNLMFNRCDASTATDIKIIGHKGHNSTVTFRSHNILINRMKDFAQNFHGPGVSHTTSGCVIRECNWRQWTPPDAHAGHPYCNLVDNSSGGLGGTSGGSYDAFPHHGENFVMWNYTHKDEKETYVNF